MDHDDLRIVSGRLHSIFTESCRSFPPGQSWRPFDTRILMTSLAILHVLLADDNQDGPDER